MKKTLVVILSMCSVYVHAQNNEQQKQEPVKQTPVKQAPEQDNSSLDGKSFRLTLKSKVLTDAEKKAQADATEEMRNENNREKEARENPNKNMYLVDEKTDTLMNDRDREMNDNKNREMNDRDREMTDNRNREMTDTTMQRDNNNMNNSTSASTTEVEMGMMDNKTLNISFNSGTMNVEVVQKTTETSRTSNTEYFNTCPYNVTSGTGSLSTFNSTCTGNENSVRVNWSGFINEGTLSGNLVLYFPDGRSDKYTFTGKPMKKDPTRKPTSSN